RHEDNNERISPGAIGTARDAVWSRRSFRRLESLVHSNRIDVAHLHNTFPLISPSAYYAVRRAGVPVVQTLHNLRLICGGAALSTNGSVCEECIERRSLLPGIVHGCYRNSRSG